MVCKRLKCVVLDTHLNLLASQRICPSLLLSNSMSRYLNGHFDVCTPLRIARNTYLVLTFMKYHLIFPEFTRGYNRPGPV